MTIHHRTLGPLHKEGIPGEIEYSAPWPRWKHLIDYEVHLRKGTQVRPFNEYLAWEFLRRSSLYQENWIEWKFLHNQSEGGIHKQLHEKAQVFESDACNRIGIETLSNPITGAIPKFHLPSSDGSLLLSVNLTEDISVFNRRQISIPTGPTITFRLTLERPLDEQIRSLKLASIAYLKTIMNPAPKKPINIHAHIKYLRVLDALYEKADRKLSIDTIYDGQESAFDKARKTAVFISNCGYKSLVSKDAYPFVLKQKYAAIINEHSGI